MKSIAIHWFRYDLRLHDNPSLYHASQHENVLPLYIYDEVNAGEYRMGSASKWWLEQSLESLDANLRGGLSLFKGDPLTIFEELSKRYVIDAIYWNRCYEPWQIKRDTHIKESLRSRNITVKTYNGSLLWEPWKVSKDDGTPYKVFTPFYKKGCFNADQPRDEVTTPTIPAIKDAQSLVITDLGLSEGFPWFKKLEGHWQIGEGAALSQFDNFIQAGIKNYKKGRDFPASNHVSRLSPHLHFGEISPHQIWHAVSKLEENENTLHFKSELGWREFSYYLLYHFPDFPHKNFQKKFDGFAWEDNESYFEAWKKGQTGIPIVDAGMRELWQTGYMHNRVRMIVASFLIKNLLIDWRKGMWWFWECLLDADLANNSAGWQWVAGSGADAAPYFRIFNPVTQGQKFDPDGEYIKKYVPELKAMPLQYLFNPWEAPANVLKEAQVKLGDNYPHPLVDLKKSREKALEKFKDLS